MDMRIIALGGFFVLLLAGIFTVASTWTAERAVEPAARAETTQTPGVPSMQR